MQKSILIIDNSRINRKRIKSILLNTGLFDIFYEASNEEAGFKIMKENKPDLVICDLFMTESDEFKFLRLKMSNKALESIPILVVADKKSLNSKLHIFEEGVQDYVTKPFTPVELIANVKSNLKIKTLQDELIATHKKLKTLKTLSNIDPLTGIYNRRFFLNTLEKEFERAKRYNRHLSLLMIDMDHFKSINDKCGHLVADKALIDIAKILNTGLRRTDVCARYGGDEFVTMLPETEQSGAISVAERYLDRIREYNIHNLCGKIKKITCSIGIAFVAETNIQNPTEFLKLADEALYIAKNTGRNRLAIYNDKYTNV